MTPLIVICDCHRLLCSLTFAHPIVSRWCEMDLAHPQYRPSAYVKALANPRIQQVQIVALTDFTLAGFGPI